MIEVVRLHEVEGLGVRAIAKRLDLSRSTVRKYLREPRVPVYGRRSRSPSKLASFLPWLIERTQEDGVWNSVRLLRELRERGYVGGKTILKDYVRPLRPPKSPSVVVCYRMCRVPGLRGSDGGTMSVRIAAVRFRSGPRGNVKGTPRDPAFHLPPPEPSANRSSAP